MSTKSACSGSRALTRQRWTNGRRMGVAKYGPTRVVYPYGLYDELDPTTYDPRSIWQLDRIVLR